MRELTNHKINGCNEAITITVRDEPGQGGACHHYRMVVDHGEKENRTAHFQELFFQNGPIAEVGTNGITHEALLAILENRLASFQFGDYACFENEKALYHIREAMMWLKHRTEKRLARGVEGTHQK
jgi:hypothetical protein